MGQVLHGSATTTEAVRRAIQHSQASLRALAEHYGINPKMVAKWKKRGSIADLPTGPRDAKSTVLSGTEAVPYRIHTVLTDNGTHFTSPGNTSSAAPLIKEAMEKGEFFRAHAFEYACAQNDIDHRLTKPRHPWTNGQAERMNRTIKDATVRRDCYDSHDQLRHHLQLFLDAYNHARRLKTLRGFTPYEYICKTWAEQPHRFITDPTHHTLGPNI